METEGIVWLKRIRDGSVLNYLKEIYEIDTVQENSRKLLYEIINSNKKGIFPRTEELEKSLNFCITTFYKHKTYLKSKNLIFDFTLPELLYVFKIYTCYKIPLPHQLDLATRNEIKKFRRADKKGSSKSWEERFQTPRTPHYSLFYIALISENNYPVFSKSFSFLEIYNSLVAPQTGQTHISLK